MPQMSTSLKETESDCNKLMKIKLVPTVLPYSPKHVTVNNKILLFFSFNFEFCDLYSSIKKILPFENIFVSVTIVSYEEQL